MKNYELAPFRKNIAFIRFKGFANGKIEYGSRICINSKGEKLFELPDKDMVVFGFEPEDVAFVNNYNHKSAMINSRGKFLTDFIYDGICAGSEEGFFEAYRNGKHGAIDIQGKEVIPCIYDDGNYFSEGVVAECLSSKWGMVDYRNNTIIPFEYEEIYVCKNNLINAKKNGKFGLINKSNEVIVDFIYDDIISWLTRDCIIYPAKKNGKWGFIDRYNNIIEDFIYDKAELLSDSDDNIGEFVLVVKDDKSAIYSSNRQEFITNFDYDFIGELSDNRFKAIKDNKSGFLDTNGDIAIPFEYDKDYHYEFCENRCTVFKDGKAGVIDLEGNIIIPFKYRKINYCKEGMIWVSDEKYQDGFLNRNGGFIVPLGKYHIHSNYNEGFTIVWDENEGDCYINKLGEILEVKI